MNPKQFFAEVKRRNVHKLTGAALPAGLFFVGRYTAGGATPSRNEWATTSNPQKSIIVLPLLDHDGGTLSLAVDPLLRGSHDDPGCKNLLSKLGLPAA